MLLQAAFVQVVDLVSALCGVYGMTEEAAVAFLDTGPPLVFQSWCEQTPAHIVCIATEADALSVCDHAALAVALTLRQCMPCPCISCWVRELAWQVRVQLMDDTCPLMLSCQSRSYPGRPTCTLGFGVSNKLLHTAWTLLVLDPCSPLNKYCTLTEIASGVKQLPSSSWQPEELRAAGYAAGVRAVVLEIKCKDFKRWAGHYGAKMAFPAFSFFASA